MGQLEDLWRYEPIQVARGLVENGQGSEVTSATRGKRSELEIGKRKIGRRTDM